MAAIARTYPEAKEEQEGDGMRAEPPIEVSMPLFVHGEDSARVPFQDNSKRSGLVRHNNTTVPIRFFISVG